MRIATYSFSAIFKSTSNGMITLLVRTIEIQPKNYIYMTFHMCDTRNLRNAETNEDVVYLKCRQLMSLETMQ